MKLYRAHLLKNPFASCCPNPLIANWKEMVFRRIIIWSFIIVLYSTWYTLIGLWTSKWTSFWPEYWSYPTSYWGEITLNFMVSETLTHNAHADAKTRSQIWYYKITNVFIRKQRWSLFRCDFLFQSILTQINIEASSTALQLDVFFSIRLLKVKPFSFPVCALFFWSWL